MSPTPFLPIIRNLQANAIRIGKENRVIIRRILRINLWRRKIHSRVLESSGDGIHRARILDSKAKMVQAGAQWIVSGGAAVRLPENETKVAIVILDVVITFIHESVFAKAENLHHLVVKPLRASQIGNGDIYVINANDFDWAVSSLHEDINTPFFAPGKFVSE